VSFVSLCGKVKIPMPKFIYLAILAVVLGSSGPVSAGNISGTFIQLNRAATVQTSGQWKELLHRAKAVGIKIL